MKEIKITRSLYEAFRRLARGGDGNRYLYLVSSNKVGVLTRSELVAEDLCTPFSSFGNIHDYYISCCRKTKYIPTCYFYIAYDLPTRPINVKDPVFYFKGRTELLYAYEYEPVNVVVIEERKDVLISKDLYKNIIDLKEAYYQEWEKAETVNLPKVFLLCKNNDNVLVKIEELEVYPGSGCEEMLLVNSANAHKKYIKLIKQGLTPCGYLSYTVYAATRRTFNHPFERDEIFLNIGVLSERTKIYIADNTEVHIADFKIKEV